MTMASKLRTSAPSIDIKVDSPLWDREPSAEQTVRGAIAAAASALATTDGEVSVVLTDDAGIKALNRDWRKIDKPTNVLSFPAAKIQGAGAAKLLGDIVIAYETLKRECDDESRIFLHHLAHLTVHGFLHLIGYDHQNDSDADKMEGLESRIMSVLKMPDPYLARDLDRDLGDA
jgi:probable rRNA maturation factor